MSIQVKTSLVGPQVNEINFRTAVRLVGCMLQDVSTVLLVFDAASLRNRFRGSLLASSSWIEICNLFGLRVCVCQMRDSVSSVGVKKSAERLNMFGVE